ncbi:hypothetical protein MTsPCn5_00480 [Croceitalea sp. MTPC5]|uniref:hypothetical protein n=1 Tax=Croceitalea sp. MTPC5 TaxID=3056565 RepID=UPI002B3B728F|nr:hypothetical protein MTsPCn5_00480 [Croceitalea sp. MTPC5]
MIITTILLIGLAYFIFNKPKTVVPKIIEKQVETALAFYPELHSTPIEFKFKKNINKSVMLAQPTLGSIFRKKEKRGYKILISEKFKITGKEFKTTEVPDDIMIGWLGHELGHVMDYQERSGLNLINFGIRYVLLKEHVKNAERAADSFAVRMGMAEYIIKTKRFILDHADIDEAYKNRIREFYLSPEEIMEMVKKRNSMND